MKSLEDVNKRIFAHIPFDEIDRDRALAQPEVLDLVREACLVESYFGVYIGHMIELFWYDLAATSMYTIEGFEAYSHYYILKRYLDIVGYRPVSEDEVIELRKKDRELVLDDEVKELVNFMATEHFAANFFAELAQAADEPVLKKILPELSKQEVTHSRFAYDLLTARIEKDETIIERIIQEARNFQHVGAYVLPVVSPVHEDNIRIIQRFNEQIKNLTGKSL